MRCSLSIDNLKKNDTKSTPQNECITLYKREKNAKAQLTTYEIQLFRWHLLLFYLIEQKMEMYSRCKRNKKNEYMVNSHPAVFRQPFVERYENTSSFQASGTPGRHQWLQSSMVGG